MALVTAVRAAIRGTGAFAVALGAIMWAGGDQRLVSPGYATAVNIAEALHASPAVFWGTTLVAAGLCVLAGRRIVAAGLFLVMVWALTFGTALAIATFSNPHAGATGAVVYAFVATMVGGLFAVHRTGLVGW